MNRPGCIPTSSVSVDPELVRLRNLLSSNRPLEIDPNGRIVEVGSKPSRNESDTVCYEHKAKTIPDAIVSTRQWYENDPDLYRVEVEAMRKEFNDPEMQPHFMKDGRMYWITHVKPNLGKDSHGREFKTMNYTVLLVYDPDHPKARYGTSVKAYLANPTLQDLNKILARLPGIPEGKRYVPHTFSDGHLCTQDVNRESSSFSVGVSSAVTSYRYTVRFLTILELGFRDPQTWQDFHSHGKI